MELFNKTQTMFNNFDVTVRSYLSKTFANLGMQYTHSQIFGVIFDGIKGVMQNAMFYIEDALNEQNIHKATRKSSIYSLAKISGFEPYYGSAATGTILLKTQVNNNLDSKSSKIFIQNHTAVVNKTTGINYLIMLPTDSYVCDISRPLITHELKIVQGNFNRSKFIAKGYKLEVMNVSNKSFFDKDYIEVKVNGEKWKQRDNLYDMTENANEYVFSTSFESGFSIMFGDGIHGRKLNEGDVITIDYLSHSGTTGNILPNTTSNFVFNNYGVDSFGRSVNLNDYIKLSISNCLSGGTNPDSIDFVRNMVGKNSRSLVFASEENFDLFFKRFSFIGNSNCWSEQNSMNVLASCTRNIIPSLTELTDYYSLTEKDILLTEEEKEMIINTLENSKRAFAGITLNFYDPVIRRFAIICYVKLNDNFERDTVKENIKNYIAKYFINNITNTQFISKSDIIKYLLNNIPQIKSIEISILSGIYEESYANKYYYDYDFKEDNSGKYTFIKNKVIYEKNTYPGLDSMGNISLKSKIEIPVLLDGFKYYIDKENNSNACVSLDAVQIYFDQK